LNLRPHCLIPSLLALTLSIGAAAPAGAGQNSGTVSLAWDSCDGPVDKTADTPGVYTAFASVVGTDLVHVLYAVTLIYGDGDQSVPDAWRFDTLGCQGASSLKLDFLPSKTIGQSCPAFIQNIADPLVITEVRFNPPAYYQYPSTCMRVEVEVAYPGSVQADPLTRYFLAGFNFDHSHSAIGGGDPPNSCGGLETPMCFKLAALNTLVVNSAYQVQSFAHDPNQSVLTFNPGSAGACAAVPARAVTWGQIKAQYR
jgi:hypothetical protein